MQFFDISIAPGKSRIIDVQGDYVYYLEGSAGGADNTIQLRNNTGADSILLRPGQAFKLGIGAHVRWVVENAKGEGTIVGKLLMGDGEFSDNRISGSVEVIDGERARTLAGNMFSAPGFAAELTAKFGIVQLWNPPASGKNVVVSAMDFGSQVTCSISVLMTNVKAIEPNSYTPANKRAGGPAPVATVVTERRTAVETFPLGTLRAAVVAGNTPKDWGIKGVLVVPPGYGLAVVANYTNASIIANFEWFEEPI